jgi:hypothetical protein
MQEYMQLNQPLLSFIVKMGSDSACLSDAARSWLEIEEQFVGLSPEDISRLSMTPSGDVALLLTLCTKRVADGLKDPLYLALLLDPRPSMVAFVHKQGLLGDADNFTLGNTEAISAAKRAIMHIAEGVPIEGKTPREVGLALCKALHMYLGVRHLFIKHACLIC